MHRRVDLLELIDYGHRVEHEYTCYSYVKSREPVCLEECLHRPDVMHELIRIDKQSFPADGQVGLLLPHSEEFDPEPRFKALYLLGHC